MKRHLTALTLCLAALQGACASFHVATPQGFAELDSNDEYDYRAMSADGVVVAVRARPNRPVGNQDFWARAVDERLRADGYAWEAEPRPLRSADGVEGTQFRYTRERGGRQLRYHVGVWVTRGRVFVAEAGGDREVFDRAAPAVERAMASITF